MLTYCLWAIIAPAQVVRMWQRLGMQRTYSDAVIRTWVSPFLLFLIVVLAVNRWTR